MKKGIIASILTITVLAMVAINMVLCVGCDNNTFIKTQSNSKEETNSKEEKNTNIDDWQIGPQLDEFGRPDGSGLLVATSATTDGRKGYLTFWYQKHDNAYFIVTAQNGNKIDAGQDKNASILFKNGNVIESDAGGAFHNYHELIAELGKGGDIIVAVKPKYGDSYRFTINTDNWMKAYKEFYDKYMRNN